MVTTLLLATLLAGQVNSPLPENAAFVSSGIPGVVGNAVPEVKMTRHHVVSQMTSDRITYSSLTTLSNSSNKPVTLTLFLPVKGVNRPDSIDFKASWQKKPLKVVQPTVYNNSRPVQARVTVTLVPRGNQVLQVDYTILLGKAGLDSMERIVAYDTSAASTWSSPIGVFSWSLKYDASVVFQKIEAQPKAVWQTGDKGSYFEVNNYSPESDGLIWFRFYPGGYNKIGF